MDEQQIGVTLDEKEIMKVFNLAEFQLENGGQPLFSTRLLLAKLYKHLDTGLQIMVNNYYPKVVEKLTQSNLL